MRKILSLVVCVSFSCSRQMERSASRAFIPAEIVGVGDDEAVILSKLGEPHSVIKDQQLDFKTLF